MQPGIYAGISNHDYHAGEGVSKSMLDVLAQRSPLHLHYLRTQANDDERQPTTAQMIGTAFHSLLLEPEAFARDYCLALRQSDVPDAIDDRDQLVAMVAELNTKRLPKLATSGSKDELVERLAIAWEQENPGSPADLNRHHLECLKLSELKAEIALSNERRPGLLPIGGTRHELAELLRANSKPVTLWSDVQAEWQRNNGQRIVLSQEQWDQLHNMRAAVLAHPAASALLSVEGWAELSAYWRDPQTGVLCRCRPDFWRKDGVIVDLKTTEDASEEEFARSIAKWRYHVQHPFYFDGLMHATEGTDYPKPKAFVFLAVEKSACVVDGQAKGVAVYVLDDESVELGRSLYRRDLATYAECEMSSKWPCYGDRIKPIRVPAWEFAKAVAV